MPLVSYLFCNCILRTPDKAFRKYPTVSRTQSITEILLHFAVASGKKAVFQGERQVNVRFRNISILYVNMYKESVNMPYEKHLLTFTSFAY